jgi:NADH dehydrogenase FAD-containing subunit
MEKVVVVVGASFAGLCAVRYILHNQYSHGFSSDGKNGKCKLKIILLDCKDYFEYYPSTIRSLITSDVSTVIKLSSLPEINHPCVTFICGKFTSLDHVSKIITYVSSNLTSGTIKFDCLLLSHGMFYNQPIKPSATFPTYASRLTEISTYREKLLRCSKIVVLGGGLIGVEYVADLVDFMNHYKKKVALLLVTRGKYLLTDLPPSAGLRARRYLEEKDVNIIFNATVSTVSPSLDCVMFKDSMCDPIHCDLVINCTGMNFSSSHHTSSEMSTSETKDSIITTYESGFANRHLEVGKYARQPQQFCTKILYVYMVL